MTEHAGGADLDQRRDDLSKGDGAAVAEWVIRDASTAALVTRVLARNADPDDIVGRAWESTLVDLVRNRTAGRLRPVLLARIVALLRQEGLVDDADGVPLPAEALFASAGEDERWAGWYVEDPIEWPPGTDLTPRRVEGVLRHLPVGARAVLVFRDVAGLTAEEADEVMAVLRVPPVPLEVARNAFIRGVDREVSG